MDYNSNTYITLLTTDAVLLGISYNNRKSNDGTITILEYHIDEIIEQNILNVVINTMTHQQALNLVETNEWKSNFPTV